MVSFFIELSWQSGGGNFSKNMEARQIIVCHFLGWFWTALSEGFRMKYPRDQMIWYMESYMHIKQF